MIDDIVRLAGPYTGKGLKQLSFGFKIFEETDVYVATAIGGELEPNTILEYGTDYSVTMNEDQDSTPGGYVTLTSAMVEGQIVVIGSGLAYTQETQLTNFSRFPPEIINTALDRIVVQIQQIVEKLGRAVLIPPTSTITPASLLLKIFQAAKDAAESAEDAAEAAAICEEIRQQIEIYSWDIPHLVDSLREVESYPFDGLFAVGGFGNPGHKGQNISNRYVKAEGGSKLRTLGERFADSICAEDFGARGDGTTDDSEAFAALEQAFSGRIIDLHGKTFAVDELPELNRYVNGKFFMGGIYYPTDDFYRKRISLVSPNNGDYNAWPQDTAHSRGGVLYTFYDTDIGHNSDYAHPVLAISVDGGNSFPFQQHLGTDKSFGQIVASAGITDAGLQLAIMQQGTGMDYPADRTYRLLARRAFEYIAFATDERTLTVSTTSGSSTLTFAFSFPHGLVKGDKLVFEYTNATVGGITISGEFTVTEVLTLSSVSVQKTETSEVPMANTAETAQVTAGGLRFSEYAKFRELKVGGESFGTALKNLANVSNNPAMVHCMCIVGDDVYCCVHGGDYAGSHIVKVSNVSFETRSISITRISTMGTEATLAYLGDGIFIGGIRPEGTSYPARFFIYNETTGDVTTNDSRFGANRFLKSPFPVRKVGDKVVFCFSDNRATLPGTYTRFVGKVPIFIAYADVADILADTENFENKLKYEKVADAFYSNTSIGDGSAAGVPSLTAIGSNLFLFYSSEHPAVIADRDGYPNVYCCCLDFYSVLGERSNSPIEPLFGYMTTAHDGINRNYSTPDWQDIPFNITLYFPTKTTSGAKVTQGLSAEFSDSVAEATVYFMDERTANAKRFSIGHNHYRVKTSPLGTFQNLAKKNQGVGVCYAPNANRLGDNFKLVCRMNSITTPGSIEYGYGDVNVQVELERPINWAEGV